MSYTYNYPASSLPVPIAPGSPSIGNGASGPFTSGMTDPIVSSKMNQYASAVTAVLGSAGGGGFGIVSGCDITSPSGLNVAMGAGIALMDTMVEFVASGSPIGPQMLVPSNATLPDNATSYLWLLSTGALAYAGTTSPPANARIPLAVVVTSGGVVTGIDYSGRMKWTGGILMRQTADRSAPADTPNSGTTFHTVTQSGTFHWNGTAYNSLTPTNAGALNCKIVMTGDVTSLPQDNFHNFQLDPNGSNRVFYLPNPANIGAGWRISLLHIGSGNNIVVKDYTGTTTYATLTTTNRSLVVSASAPTGTVSFPAGPWSPGPIPTPTAGALV